MIDIKDIDVVHYVLANALKANLIKVEQLGLVFYYLETVNAPPIYYQYTILRLCQNIQDCKLFDISLALQSIDSLIDGELQEKTLMKITNYLEVTNDRILLKDGTNFRGLVGIYNNLVLYEMGGPHLLDKLERLILREFKTKDKKQTMDF